MFAFIRFALFLVLAGVATARSAGAEAPFNLDTTPGQLPKTVVPSAYRIAIRPDLHALTFTGTETIAIEARATTSTIVLDSVGLAFQRVALDGNARALRQTSFDPKREIVRLTFAAPIARGRHTLSIAYAGPIPATPTGIYYDDYPTPSGTKRMLVTQFESNSARRMFPGFDEPAFKATVQLSATLPRALVALSNTPIVRDAPAPNDARGEAMHTVAFARTPKMSTYLVVLVAGDLRRVTRTLAGGTQISVWSPAGREAEGRLALATEATILPYYENYFGVRFPLPKLDLVAIPGNFAAGAMENWGGITFIDNDLLFAPGDSTVSTRQLVYQVVAHEMAHQWSGDLVTMAWWNDIWLNEGFADWMDTKATDHFNPSWNIWLSARADKETAMGIDAHRTTHPVQQAVPTEADIGLAFDSLAYLKGETFLRMLETYLGENTFRDGMRRYMRKHAYSNTTTADLWAALGAASGKPVAAVAAGFTEQPGVPQVNVATACANGATTITLTQSRFVINDPTAAHEVWQIPVRVASFAASPMSASLVLGAAPQTIRFAGCGQPISANFGDTGYYRVAYDDAGLRALRNGYRALPAADRAALVADQWGLVQSGTATLASYVDLLGRLDRENQYAVWSSVIAAFVQIDQIARPADRQAAWHTYARSALNPVLARLGWDARPSDTSDDMLLRASVITTLGRFDDPAVVAEAQRRFAAFVSDPSSLPANLRTPVVNVVGWHANQATFDQLHALGRAATSTEAKLRYFYALAGARDPALIDETVKIALTDELPNGRVNRFLSTAAGSDGDPRHVFDATLAIYDALAKKLSVYQLASLLPSIVRSSSDPALAAQLQALPQTAADPDSIYQAKLAAGAVADRAALGALLAQQAAAWPATP